MDVIGKKMFSVKTYLTFYRHGCPIHFPHRDQVLPDRKTPAQLFMETEKRTNILRSIHNVEVFWECEIQTLLKASPLMRKFFDSTPDTAPIHFNDAFYGGR